MKAVRVLCAAVLMTSVLCAGLAHAEEWRLVQNKKGKVEDVKEPSKLKDKDWLQVAYTEFAGYKPRLGVMISQEKVATSGEVQSDWAVVAMSIWGKKGNETNPFNHIEDMVRQGLGATNRFTMVERTTATEDVLGEQDLGESGRVDTKTAAKTGKMKGADYTVKATIIELNPEKEAKSIKAVGGAMGSSAIGIGSIGVSGTVSFCRLNVRIIRTETGEIVQDMTVDGTASSSGTKFDFGGLGVVGDKLVGGGASVDSKKAALMSDAMQACANKIAYAAAMKFREVPWEGAVAKVSESKIYISAGTNVGLKPGLMLELLSKGETITDPSNGEVLGAETEKIGQLRIVTAQEKMATCEIVDGGTGVKIGDIVRLLPVQAPAASAKAN